MPSTVTAPQTVLIVSSDMPRRGARCVGRLFCVSTERPKPRISALSTLGLDLVGKHVYGDLGRAKVRGRPVSRPVCGVVGPVGVAAVLGRQQAEPLISAGGGVGTRSLLSVCRLRVALGEQIGRGAVCGPSVGWVPLARSGGLRHDCSAFTADAVHVGADAG